MIGNMNEETGIMKRFGFAQFRFVVAGILLLAAGLKAWQFATVPTLGEGLLHARWFNILVVEFELFFGIWLIVGMLPKLTWLATIGCFSVFALVSLCKALSGEASCGCFGTVTVNPWITAVADIVIIGFLLRFRPASPISAVNAPNIGLLLESYWFRSTFLTTFILLLAGTIQVYLFFGSFVGLGNFMTPQEIAFEIDKSFESQNHDTVGILVSNKTDATIRLVGVRLDCGCGKIEGIPLSISPRSQSRLLFVAGEGVDRNEKARYNQQIVFFVDGKGSRRVFAELPLFEFLVRR
jgi:hypothetical protein